MQKYQQNYNKLESQKNAKLALVKTKVQGSLEN